jgi:hypothetical protein
MLKVKAATRERLPAAELRPAAGQATGLAAARPEAGQAAGRVAAVLLAAAGRAEPPEELRREEVCHEKA